MRRAYGRFAAQAAEWGWEIAHLKGEEEGLTRISVRVARGDESIYIWWLDGKLTVAPVYTFLGVETKLRNASAALQQMSEKPAAKRVLRTRKKAVRRGLLAENSDLTKLARDLPWNPDDMEDPILLKALYGRTVIWTNGITDGLEEDTIRPGVNWDKMKYHVKLTSKGRRVVSFLGNTGYRAFAIEQLLRVI